MKNVKSDLPNYGSTSEMQAKIDSLQKLLDNIAAGNKELEKNLAKFDTLDFVIFTQQDWVRFHENHSDDVVVYWPDGHHT
ncbi:MAG: hypothetical protein J7502_05975, partial [Flavisolibacter sp.]|nr:hypothetical protein [Flavisolibacter sp.]